MHAGLRHKSSCVITCIALGLWLGDEPCVCCPSFCLQEAWSHVMSCLCRAIKSPNLQVGASMPACGTLCQAQSPAMLWSAEQQLDQQAADHRNGLSSSSAVSLCTFTIQHRLDKQASTSFSLLWGEYLHGTEVGR